MPTNYADLDRDVLIGMLQDRDTRRQARQQGGGSQYWQNRTGNTGVSGYGAPGGVTTPPLDPGAATPAAPVAPVEPAAPAATPAQSYNMRGFEQSKLAAPADQQSEKYKIGNVMKQFNPLQGVTPEMLAALNALDIAKFSGSGDKLTVENTKNDPRFGKGGTADVVYGYKGQNQDTAWQPWFIDEGGGSTPNLGQVTMPDGQSSFGTISSLVPTDNDFYKKLQDQMAEILGGYSSMDRNALLGLLKQ